MINIRNILLETEEGILKVVTSPEHKKAIMEKITEKGLVVEKCNYFDEWEEQ